MNARSLFLIFLLVVLLSAGTASAETVNITVSEDTFINESAPTLNYGDAIYAESRNNPRHWAYFKFDLEQPVSSAYLYVYVFSGYGSGGQRCNYIDNTWDADTVTYNSHNPTSIEDYDDARAQNTTLGTSGSSAGWKVFDVSDVVSSSGTYSFGITSNSGNWAKYKTLESEESEYYAYLSVESLPTYSPIYVNSAHVNASDDNNGTIDYPFKTVSAAAKQIASNGTIYINGSYNETVSFIGSDNVTVTSYLEGGHISNGVVVSDVEKLYFENITISSSTYGFNFNTGSGSNIFLTDVNINASSSALIFNTGSLASNVTLDNCSIVSNSVTAGQGVLFFTNAHVNNVTIENTYINGEYSTSHGVCFAPGSGTNISIKNSDVYGGENAIMIGNVVDTNHPSNILLERLNIYGGQGRDGGSGIFLRGGENITLEYINYMESTYTAMKTTDNFNSTMGNNIIYPLGATHNAIEVKGQYNHYYNNTVYWNETSRLYGSNNVFYGAGSQHDHHILFENGYANGTRGDFIQTGGHQNNIIYRNVTGVDHHSRAIAVFGSYFSSFDYESGYISSDQILFDNITIGINETNGDRHIALHTLGSSPGGAVTDQDNYTRDRLTFIDVAIENRNYEMWGFYDGATALKHHYADVIAINPNAETTYWNINNDERCESVLHIGYYPKIRVVNPEGQAVEGANINFVSNATNPETSEKIYARNIDYGGVEKAYTDTINDSQTLSTGYLPNRYENASGAVALTSMMKYYTSSAQTEYVEWNVTATYDGTSNSTIITPDMLRYSPDSSNIQSDLVSIVLDVDITEYWTPTPGTHYIGVPETHSWIGGEWVVTYSGTYTEAQTEVTGVEIRP
jgi:hypothetical protein